MKSKILATTFATLTLMTGATGCIYHETSPRIKEGKFHFSVTYEMDGEVETLAGVYVAKFVKIGHTHDCAYRVWDGYVETNELRTRLEEDCTFMVLKTTEDGTIYLDFNLYPQYFLAEPGYEQLKGNEPDLYINYNDAVVEEKLIYRDYDPAVLESYGVKVISYQYDEPIENIYE